jgi:hypothetical protein
MWATVDDVAAHMRVPADDYMASKLDVALDWAARKRPDLDRYTEQSFAIREAVCRYTAQLIRTGSSPQSPGYPTDVVEQSWDDWARITDLIGRRLVAR